MAPHSGDKTPIAMTGTQKDTLPSTTGGSAGEGHAGGIMDKIKGAMGGAPWQVGMSQTTLALRVVRVLFNLHWVPGHSCSIRLHGKLC